METNANFHWFCTHSIGIGLGIGVRKCKSAIITRQLISDMKELSPPNVNMRRLYETETQASEPILIIISAGADPSQELEELAKQTIGAEKYHQVRIA